jgi:hypothetical protein
LRIIYRRVGHFIYWLINRRRRSIWRRFGLWRRSRRLITFYRRKIIRNRCYVWRIVWFWLGSRCYVWRIIWFWFGSRCYIWRIIWFWFRSRCYVRRIIWIWFRRWRCVWRRRWFIIGRLFNGGIVWSRIRNIASTATEKRLFIALIILFVH